MKTKKHNNIYIFIFLVLLSVASFANTITLENIVNNAKSINTEIYHLNQQVELWNARLKAAKVLAQCKQQNINCENTHKIDSAILVKKINVDNKSAIKKVYHQKQIAPKVQAIYSKSVNLSSNNPDYSYSGYFNVGQITLDGWSVVKINIDSVDFYHKEANITKQSQLFWSN